MLIHLTNLIGLAVASLHEEAKIGEVQNVVLNPQTGELVGFWVKVPGWFAKPKALSYRDVVAYEPSALVVRNADVLVEAQEIKPFERAARHKRANWLGRPVVSEEGKSLGRVQDVILDTNLDTVAKIHVSALFGTERVIDRSNIVDIKEHEIVVRDWAKSKMKMENRAVALEEA